MIAPSRDGTQTETMRGAVSRRARRGRNGFTLAELVLVCAILVILAAVSLPVVSHSIKKNKENDLRLALRQMRNAVDEYKRFSDAGLLPLELGSEGYPTELEQLVEGVDVVGQIDRQVKFLRRIPLDPMTGEYEWGMRSYQDDWDSTSWGGENIFDVYSLSEGVGLNGIPYAEW